MRFYVETRALPTDEWARLQSSYPVRLAISIAKNLIADGLEARVVDSTGWQLFPAEQDGAPSPGTGLAELSTVGATGTQTI